MAHIFPYENETDLRVHSYTKFTDTFFIRTIKVMTALPTQNKLAQKPGKIAQARKEEAYRNPCFYRDPNREPCYMYSIGYVVIMLPKGVTVREGGVLGLVSWLTLSRHLQCN